MRTRGRLRGPLAPAALVAATLAAACTTTTDDPTTHGATSPAGRATVGALDVTLAATACARTTDATHLTGVAYDDHHGAVIVEAQVHGEEADVTVRTVVDGDVAARFVADALAAPDGGDLPDGEALEVAGPFVSFDGAAQAGTVEGEIGLRCPPSGDPGGGAVVVDGSQQRVDLVACLSTPGGYEVRARSLGEVEQVLTLRRSRTPAGWTDRLDMSGQLPANERRSFDDEATDPREATGGLFEVQASRVTAEGPLLGDERYLSVDVTCGIDLVVTGD